MQNSQLFQLSLASFLGATALSTTVLATSLAGCVGDEFTTAPADDDAGVGGDGGNGGDGGSIGDGGHGGEGGEGGTSVLGTQYIPKRLLPTLGQKLEPKYAFLLWSAPSAIPDGKMFDHYDVCWTIGTVSDLGDQSQCPNAVKTAKNFAFISPLTAGSQYFWKIRESYSDGDSSYYSSAFPFLTDSSTAGWWPMDGNGNDASGSSHTGTAQNGASFAAGLTSQALSLDGTNDNMNVPSSDDHNFGTDDFTLSAWINPARDGIAEALVTKRSTTNGYELYRTAGGQLAFYGTNCGVALTAGNLPSGKWHKIAATRSAGMVFLYIDEVSVGSASCGDDFTNSAALTFGINGTTEAFKGLLEEVSVRQAASDDADVLNDYCAEQALSGASTMPTACQ